MCRIRGLYGLPLGYAVRHHRKVEKAVKALQGYERIECFLDNDDAGRRTFQRLHDCFGEKVIDRSALYADYKDLNEFLLSENAENNV